GRPLPKAGKADFQSALMGNLPLWALGAERRPSPTLTGRHRPTAAKGREGRLPIGADGKSASLGAGCRTSAFANAHRSAQADRCQRPGRPT
ncbi:MAG: hypothetical protein N3B68_06305, partial [Anaerolineae bacterium]|nr:hypothetical protein [Anaerolineae bacterium]